MRNIHIEVQGQDVVDLIELKISIKRLSNLRINIYEKMKNLELIKYLKYNY